MSAGGGEIDFSDTLVGEKRHLSSEDGVVSLAWEVPPGSEVELQQASEGGFADPVLRYAGSEGGSVITGLPEGVHCFRIRAVDTTGRPGPWSGPFEVRVTFLEEGRLFVLLILGGFVVVCTVGAIVAGHLKTRREA